MRLTVAATATDTDTSALPPPRSSELVLEQADAPSLSAPASLSLDEEGTVALNISASAAELDQNAPTILIAGVPRSAEHTAGLQSHNGTVCLTPVQINGLTLTVCESTP